MRGKKKGNRRVTVKVAVIRADLGGHFGSSYKQ